MKKLKIATILGTRPEIIRLSRVMSELDNHCDHIVIHTGQNWDYELNEIFFQDLSIRKPDYFLGVDTSSLGSVLGGILIETEKVLKETRPDAVVILGDTNSSIAAIIARRMKIPIYHMEAGNRSFDKNVPEETNRRMVDHISDFNLVYTEHGRRHLLSEGIAHRRIYVTGSPMREVLDYYSDQIANSNVLSQLNFEPKKYFIVSIHREENVDSKARLLELIHALMELSELYGYPIIVSTHPRTKNRLDKIDISSAKGRILFSKPFGFHDYICLQKNCLCAISDSGTIAEESTILGFAAITPRDAIERPEALDAGGIIATGVNKSAIVLGVKTAISFQENRPCIDHDSYSPKQYQIVNTSERVVKLIVGTAKLSNSWDGIRTHDYT